MDIFEIILYAVIALCLIVLLSSIDIQVEYKQQLNNIQDVELSNNMYNGDIVIVIKDGKATVIGGKE